MTKICHGKYTDALALKISKYIATIFKYCDNMNKNLLKVR